MPRRRRNLPLWLRLLVRRLRSPEGKLAPLAVISIAVSVTLATGLEMGSRSAQRQLQLTADAIAGSAELEVTAGDVGLDESILDLVRSTPGVRAASPLVSEKLRLVDADFALNLIGVDLLAEEQVRSTAIERNGLQIRDPLRLLVMPNSVVVTEALLERLGLTKQFREGARAELRVRCGATERTLVVQGVLRPTGLAAAFSGQVALMDVYAAQELAGRAGLFDRIDIVPQVGQDVPELMAALGSRLSGVATVRRASGHDRGAEDLLEMVRRSALMLAAAAALVATLLTYATTAQWVERQKRQLATLRAVGMEARRVQRMVFVEVTALAVVGTALGIGGGIAISPPLLSTVSTFLEVVQIEELSGVSLRASTVWLAIGVGVFAGIAGSALPAYRAGRRYTLDSLDVDLAARGGRYSSFWLGVATLTAFALVATVGRTLIDGGAMILLVVLFLLGPAAIVALSPSMLNSLRILLRPIERSRPAVGHLVTRFYHARPWTFAVALTSISTLVAVLVTVFLLIETIGSAFDRYAESLYPGGAIRVLASPVTSRRTRDVLSAETVDLIRGTPGITAVNEQYRALPSVIFRGRTIPLAALSMRVVAERGYIAAVGRPSAELARDLEEGSVAVSTGFNRTFGLGPGDWIELDTLHGARKFNIVGIFEDFGDASGSILLDLATFDMSWRRAGATSAVIWFEGPSERVLAEIRRRVGAKQDLYFVDGREAAVATRRYAEVFTSTLHVLGAFISSLGAIGVMILLAGVIAERRRDLAVLRAAGAEPGHLVAIVFLDALVLGILGSGCGLALGLACAAPAVDILREYFGWILEQRWTAPQLPLVVSGAFLAAILGALLPARMAFKVGPDDIFGPE